MHIAPTDITNSTSHFRPLMNGLKALGQHYEEIYARWGIILQPNQQLLTHVFPLHQQFMVKHSPTPPCGWYASPAF